MTMSYENNFVSKPTKNSEIRKIRKPLMEKKRRARINSSLNELKRILLDYSNIIREGSRPAKLEKADILEMTVRHLQNLHQLSRRRESISDDRSEVIPTANDQRTMSAVHQPPNFFLCSGSGKEEEWRGSDKRGGKTLPDDVADTPCERVRGTGVTGPSSHLSPSSLERTESPKPMDGIRCELETSCLVWRPWQGMRDS